MAWRTVERNSQPGLQGDWGQVTKGIHNNVQDNELRCYCIFDGKTWKDFRDFI